MSQLILGTNIQSDFKNQSHEAPKLQRKYKNQKQAISLLKQLHWRRLFCATTSYPFPKGRNLVVSYLQTHIWLQSGFIESIEINPLEYLSARGWGRGANNTKDNWRKFTTSTNHAMQVCEMCSFRSNKKRCCQDCNCKTEMCQNPLKYVLCIYMFLLHYFRYL